MYLYTCVCDTIIATLFCVFLFSGGRGWEHFKRYLYYNDYSYCTSIVIYRVVVPYK